MGLPSVATALGSN